MALGLGSSPLARGALLAGFNATWPSGIIPACAGSTRLHIFKIDSTGDHPRLRGEHRTNRRFAWSLLGSSPLARGALLLGGAVTDHPGIIPACAGSTSYRFWRSTDRWDHPRLRGEHLMSLVCTWSTSGSSPLARGAHLVGDAAQLAIGIIPACAGSTSSWSRFPSWTADHPRLRGEHHLAQLILLGVAGSSPLARGAPGRFPQSAGRRGIIPACAGSTNGAGMRASATRDHPRLRGEHIEMDTRFPSCEGSSPLARGAPAPALRHQAQRGIIPACAGST